MAIVSISQAAKLVRKGRQTLYNHNNKGKLSFTRTEEGKPGVDTSELERVYGKLYLPADKIESIVRPSTSEPNKFFNKSLDTNSDRRKKVDSVAFQSDNDIGNPVHDETVPTGVNNLADAQLSNSVSMNMDTVSTLSWFVEQLDQAKKNLADTKAELAERNHTLTELRKAIAVLPSPESVDQRLAEQADQLAKQHNKTIEAEREQLARVLAEQRARTAQESERWQQSIAERKSEIRQARAEADEIRLREAEQARQLSLVQQRVDALESRGIFARLFNKKPLLAT